VDVDKKTLSRQIPGTFRDAEKPVQNDPGMKNSLIAYLVALLFLLVADAIWLGLVMTGQYQAWLGPLMREQPLLWPAAAFYLAYPVGLVVFGVLPGLERQRWQRSAALSALFGLLAYGTYDLSNLATLNGWPVQLALADMAWGAALSCCAGSAGYFAARAWGRRNS
jgi:uncharacterized membrane protein